MIFSCWSWLAVLLVGSYKRRRRRRRRRRWSGARWRPSLVYSVLFDIWHHVMINWHLSNSCYLLTNITRQYRGLKLIAHRGHVFYLSWPLTKCYFPIGSHAHVRFTCWKQSRVVRKPVNSNPGSKVNQIITISSPQMFLLTALFLCIGFVII